MSPPASVFAAFSVLKDHVNLKVNREAPQIDNIIFKFHYRATFLVLLSSSILVSSRQFFGEHIKCLSDAGVSSSVIDSFCFFTSTFTVNKYMNATALRDGEIPHPGVGPQSKHDKDITYHAYYQWVPFVLFLQALLFYLPHHIWRSVEGGRLKMLVSGLHMAAIALREEQMTTDNGVKVLTKMEKDEKIRQMRVAFMNRLHLNRPWAYYLGVCELMNFVNVLFQVLLTNWFLRGSFFELGQVVTNLDSNQPMNGFDVIFPKVTKCTFHKYGPSGDIQKHDALCVMALNIINEKIYAFLWFWFFILAVATALGLLWRLLTMLLHARSMTFNKYVFKLACPGKYQPWNVLRVTNEYYFGDWLFLYYIARNVENYVFKELLEGLALDFEQRRIVMYRTMPKVVDEEDEPLKKTEYSEHACTVHTDHKLLIFAANKSSSKASERRARQMDYIYQFQITFEHVKGKDNVFADALSRAFAVAMPLVLNPETVAHAQTADSELPKLIPYLPNKLRKKAFELLHNLAHSGVRATVRLVSGKFIWPGIRKDANFNKYIYINIYLKILF